MGWFNIFVCGVLFEKFRHHLLFHVLQSVSKCWNSPSLQGFFSLSFIPDYFEREKVKSVFSFSMKMSPQSLLYQFHSILLHHLSKKNFSYTCLTSMPSRRFCVNKPSSTQAEFFNWTFFFFLSSCVFVLKMFEVFVF